MNELQRLLAIGYFDIGTFDAGLFLDIQGDKGEKHLLFRMICCSDKQLGAETPERRRDNQDHQQEA